MGFGDFWITLRPPFLFVYPCESECIIPISFPPLVHQSSYTGHSKPVVHVAIPIPYRGRDKPVSLNSWQPVQLRPGVDFVPSEGFLLDHIIHFPPLSESTPLQSPLQCAPQSTDTFKEIPIASINVVAPDGDALVCEVIPSQDARAGGLDLKVDAFPQHTDGHFQRPHSQTWSMAELHWEIDSTRILTGPVCPTSGSVPLSKVDVWGYLRGREDGGYLIAIASFD